MTRLGALVAAVAAFVRGEPIVTLIGGAIVADVCTQLLGDGLQRGELVRIAASAVLMGMARAKATSAANPALPTLPTDPALPAPTVPVLTLSGWRR